MSKNHVTEKMKKVIMDECMHTLEKSPIKIAKSIMKEEGIRMHGPEHHFLVAAVLMQHIKMRQMKE